MTADTRRQAVLEELERAQRDNAGGWISTRRICSDEVGGPNGTRRLRELRESGIQIEMRTEKGTAWYRLAGPRAEPEPEQGCAVCPNKTIKGSLKDRVTGRVLELCETHYWRFIHLSGFEDVR